MRVVNGKWVDSFGNGINQEELNGQEFVTFREKFIGLYGSNVTHSRIDILHHVMCMNESEERALSSVLNNGLLKRFRL
jgi:hypothetical protein